MATISENLQIIADSTAAIKQAIIDKGGEITGDITTWASAISGISGGGSSSEEEYVFTGTILRQGTQITLYGSLSSKPELAPIFLVLVYFGTEASVSRRIVLDLNALTISIDVGEPLVGDEIPGICLMHSTSGKIFPVTFNQTASGSGGNPN